MRNIWKIFTTDIRRISNNVVAVVIIMGLSILPALYAWFNIFSNWDPYEPAATSQLKVAVASSSAAPDIMKMLTEGGLKAMVDFAFSGEDCAAHKPAPDIYLKALNALGLTADKAIAVEDSPTGIASAKAAGLKVLALKPRHGEPLDQSAADCIITQLMDVKEHLD